jgi:hypothetical protein
MEKVKCVLFKMELKGRGIVNNDSNDQKFIYNQIPKGEEGSHLKAFHNNVMYGKKAFSTEDGKLKWKLKISTDCLMRTMFQEFMISTNPNIMHSDYVLYSYLAHPAVLLKGHANFNKTETIARSSSITICDAIQTSNAVSALEVCSRSGEKKTNDGTDDTADNTYFSKENVGDIEYATEGVIDLMNLQFISCDNVFGRYSFNPDKYIIFKEFLKRSLPNFNNDLGYYQPKNSAINIPEYGILLSDENVSFLIKYAIKRLLGINVRRRNAFAKVSVLKIKLVYDPITDTMDNENGWITINNYADADALNLNTECFYELIDLEKSKQLRSEIETKVKEMQEKDKAEKEKKLKEKKDKKAKKSNDDDNE